MIHPPKHLTSTQGLGLNTLKEIEWLAEDLAITTERWPELETPWRQGEVVIADVGYSWKTRWHLGSFSVKTDFFNASMKHIGTYYDICRPVQKEEGGFSFDDLYLDVWIAAGSSPELLDEDEFTEAIEAGRISLSDANYARKEAERLMCVS